MSDSASSEAEADVTLSSQSIDQIASTSSEKTPLVKNHPGHDNAFLAPSTNSTRQYRKSASDLHEKDEDSGCCAFNLTANEQSAVVPDVNCNDFPSGMGELLSE